MYFNFFFTQGRKSKLAQITGTIIIFKPKFSKKEKLVKTMGYILSKFKN